jgi:hypothetical protein
MPASAPCAAPESSSCEFNSIPRIPFIQHRQLCPLQIPESGWSTTRAAFLADRLRKFAKKHALTDPDEYLRARNLALVPDITDVNYQRRFCGEKLPFCIILPDADVHTKSLFHLVEAFRVTDKRKQNPVWSQILHPPKPPKAQTPTGGGHSKRDGQPPKVEALLNITVQPRGVRVPVIKLIDPSEHLQVAEPTYNATPAQVFCGYARRQGPEDNLLAPTRDQDMAPFPT